MAAGGATWITSLLTIGGVARWAWTHDRASVSDDDAITHITANMKFNAVGNNNGGTRRGSLDPAVVTAGPDAAYAAPVRHSLLTPVRCDATAPGRHDDNASRPCGERRLAGVGTFLMQTGWSDGVIELRRAVSPRRHAVGLDVELPTPECGRRRQRQVRRAQGGRSSGSSARDRQPWRVAAWCRVAQRQPLRGSCTRPTAGVDGRPGDGALVPRSGPPRWRL